jgi:hypothetical protein
VGRGFEYPPRALAEELIAIRQRAIIVVDNCPGSLHRILTDLVNTPGSSCSLLTIEFDVGDDEFDATTEFRLDIASDDLIVELLKQRDLPLSDVDRLRVAEFAGGNARMALALARTATTRGSLANLDDREFLERLFGRDKSEARRRAAEVASLVYSFDLETKDGDDAEVPYLEALGGLNDHEFYRAIRELQQQELVQQRGRWRALLPQGLAAKLARVSLETTRPEDIWGIFVESAPDRLLCSFARRLGLLHDCSIANLIAKRLLADNGPLGKPETLRDAKLSAFINCAPAAPDASLAALERAIGAAPDEITSVARRDRYRLASLARALAYSPAAFPRAALIVAAFVAVESPDHKDNSTASLFDELFHVVLSGTQAGPGVRVELIDSLLNQGAEPLIRLASRALRAMLKTIMFSTSHTFQFGAWQRDSGWVPNSADQQREWYTLALDRLRRLATRDSVLANSIFSERFRELWRRGGCEKQIVICARELATISSGVQVWFAVCRTLHFDREAMSSEALAELHVLERELRPLTLEQRVSAFVIAGAWEWQDPDGAGHRDTLTVGAERAYDLGIEIGIRTTEAEKLVAGILEAKAEQAFHFGRGLADGADSEQDVWNRLLHIFGQMDTKPRSAETLTGFVSAISIKYPDLSNHLLDNATTIDSLSPFFVRIQSACPIDSVAVNRLIGTLETGFAPVWSFRHLVGGGCLDNLPFDALRRLVLAVAATGDGFPVAVEMFGQRIHGAAVPGTELRAELGAIGREILELCLFKAADYPMFDYYLGQIAENCLTGKLSVPISRKLCASFKKATQSENITSSNSSMPLMAVLCQHQPFVILDELVGLADCEWKRVRVALCGLDADDDGGGGGLNDRPVHAIPMTAIQTWLAVQPQDRAKKLATMIKYSEIKAEIGTLHWTPLAIQLICTPNVGADVLQIFFDRFSSGVIHGSFETRYVMRRPMLLQLIEDGDSIIAAKAKSLLPELDQRIAWAQDLRIGEMPRSFE